MNQETRYALAKQGVFATIQGEGILLGLPMIFVRLAGCSIGCSNCDTDYRKDSTATAHEIAQMAVSLNHQADWVWVTGGEPTDHDLTQLILELRRAGYRIAIATAGAKPIQRGRLYNGADFLSVSPHSHLNWVQRSGDQVNLVVGLNGLNLYDMIPIIDQCENDFSARYVTPLWYKPSDREERTCECLEFIRKRPNWRLGIQAHKYWGIP